MIYLNRQSLSTVQIQTKIYSDSSSRGKELGPFSFERVPTKLLHRFYFSLRYDIGNFFERKFTLRIRKWKDQKHFIFQRQKHVFIYPTHFYSIKLFIFFKDYDP